MCSNRSDLLLNHRGEATVVLYSSSGCMFLKNIMFCLRQCAVVLQLCYTAMTYDSCSDVFIVMYLMFVHYVFFFINIDAYMYNLCIAL